MSVVQRTTVVGCRQHFCSICDAEVLNFMSQEPYWQCDHGPDGPARRRKTDREILQEIHAMCRTILRRSFGIEGPE
jgi:hypothetical protein